MSYRTAVDGVPPERSGHPLDGPRATVRRHHRPRGAPAPAHLVTKLGFGHANVVVAVPQAWIDVKTMSDLEDVASGFRARHGQTVRMVRNLNVKGGSSDWPRRL